MIYAGGKEVLSPDEIDPDVLDFASTIPIPDEKGEPGPGPFLPQEEINRIFDEVFANDSETIECLDETLYDTNEVD